MILRSELDFARGLEITLLRRLLVHHFALIFLLLFPVFIPSVEPDRGLQDQEDIVAGPFDFADRFRDPVGLGKGIVDRVSQFLHEVLQWLFHGYSVLMDAPGYTGV